jgi:hypothetical protein
VEEKDGLPVALPGLDAFLDLDAETLRLEQIARAGLQPRIAGLAFHPVTLASGGRALVIRVPRSYDPPHRVIFQGKNRFWARSSAGKFEPEVGELRVLFSVVPQLTERIREFRATRIGQIVGGETPVPLNADSGRIIVHVVPFASLEPGAPINIEAAMQKVSAWMPWKAGSADYRINFDGFVVFAPANPETRAYVQVMRNGGVESVATGILDKDRFRRPAIYLEQTIGRLLDNVTRVTDGLRNVDVTSPLAVLVSMMDVRGASFLRGATGYIDDPPLPTTRRGLTFAEAVIPDGEKGRERVAVALEPFHIMRGYPE